MNRFARFVVVALLAPTALRARAQAAPAEPKPEDAQRAILAAFDTYPVVAMLSGHRYKDIDDFILTLLRNPELPNRVNDIVVEVMNSKYQPLLDRYIGGDDVPIDSVRKLWRSLQPGVSPYLDQLVPLVRRINQRLPANKRLRMLAGEPPVDWNTVTTREQVAHFLGSGDRESSPADIIQKEVLAKKRKALVLYGTGHLNHNIPGMIVGRIEQNHPGSVFVIDLFAGTGCDRSAPRTDSLTARMASWPVPSIARIKGTWLAEFARGLRSPFPVEGAVDALLYLGPPELLLYEYSPAHIWLDSAYLAEYQRKAQLPTAATARARNQTLAAEVLTREPRALFCDVER